MVTYTVFTYTNPQGKRCVNFTEETDLIYKKAESYYRRLTTVCGGILSYETALNMINTMAKEKGYEIAGQEMLE